MSGSGESIWVTCKHFSFLQLFGGRKWECLTIFISPKYISDSTRECYGSILSLKQVNLSASGVRGAYQQCFCLFLCVWLVSCSIISCQDGHMRIMHMAWETMSYIY